MRHATTFALLAAGLLVSSTAWAQDAPPSEPAQPDEPAAATGEAPATTDAATPDAADAPAETPDAMAEPMPPAEPAPAIAEPAPAVTASAPEPEPSSDDWPIMSIAPHISVLMPQPFTDLGTWPVFGLELGFIAPFDAGSMKRPLQISLDVGYTQPVATGTDPAASLGPVGDDGTGSQNFDWELTQKTLTLDLTAMWRFMPPARALSFYVEYGARMYMMESVMVASSGGSDFGENTETKTEYGMIGALGVEYWLAVGSLYGALEMGWSNLDTRITGDSNTAALTVDVGYRFMF